MDSLAELRARQQEIEQEWQWLHDTLNVVARARAEQGDAAAFRLMQGQAMRVGQRRVELDVQIAELERQRLHSAHDHPSASLPEMWTPQHRHLSR
jgi:hypothetical protein